MIPVDPSFWIDSIRGTSTRESEKLESLMSTEPVAVSDLILTEVLQGFGTDREFNGAKRLLTGLIVIDLGGRDLAVEAAKNFRKLRARGTTVRTRAQKCSTALDRLGDFRKSRRIALRWREWGLVRRLLSVRQDLVQ